MNDDTLLFYEELADVYHLIFADWQDSVERQAGIFDMLIRLELGRGPEALFPVRVLDCSCGIGTQAIGLASRGYTVHATDLSPASVGRAEQEARRFGVTLTTGVADFRLLAVQVEGQFDVVLSGDNALPHLLTEADLNAAFRSMAAKLKPGGLLVLSIRDYDHLLAERPSSTEVRVLDGAEGRRIVFQVWDWAAEAPTYEVNQFILRQTDSGWETLHFATTYRALLRSEVERHLTQAGFDAIRWHMDVFYQPVVTARRPG